MYKIRPAYWRRRRYEKFSRISSRDKKRNFLRLLMMLLILLLANVIAMVVLEGLSLNDATWLTLTTITTVGYGDMSAETLAGRTVTIILMYIFGISLLANLAAEFIDYRMDQQDKKRKGLLRWNMKDHIVIVNTPDKDSSRYLQILVEQIRKSDGLEDYPIQIFSASYPEGLPDDLASLGVVLRQGRPEGQMGMDEVDVEDAAFIIVLAADTSDFRSDSITLDILDQLRRYKLRGYVIAECVQEQNRSRLREFGANAVLRPVRAYPELMVRAMAAPGTEQILEDLFQHQGVHPHRYDIDIPSQPWGQLAARLALDGLGTPLGYVDADNNVVTNPAGEQVISGGAIFLMVSHDRIPESASVARCVMASADA